MRRKAALLSFCVLICLLMSFSVHAARITNADPSASPAQFGESTRVTIDFRDVDIHTVAKFISDLTGKNFIFDHQVNQKVTLFSPTPVTPDEAYRLFETVLKLNGFTTIPSDTAVRIVPSLKARTMDIETRKTPPTGKESMDDRMVTQIVKLDHANAAEMVNLLRPLIDKTGALLAYESGNTLVVTDYASNINRLLAIISTIDIAGEGTKLAVIPLRHASAKDLAEELQGVLKTKVAAKGAAPGSASRFDYDVVADERTNSLIIMARANEIKIIRDLTRRLDTPSKRGSDRVHVVFLKNAVAEDLAGTLNELAGATAGSQAAQQQAGAPSPLLLQEPVFITAEKSTNALIIRANRQDFLVLQDIIEKLDIQRSQVLVEAIIMEVTVSRANALGAEWNVLNPTDSGTQFIGGTNLPVESSQGLINQLATNPFAGPGGLILGAAEGTITWNGTTILNIGALIQALETDTDVDILSTPHLLTMDNEKARIVVGEERPFLKSSMDTSTGSTSPTITNTYEFKDLGLTLEITPHITQGQNIKLKLFQQLQSFVSEAETGAVTSTKRETETVIMVQNRETIVIGGLIQQDKRENKSQVPCLGDIPFLGWAAKRRSQKSDKTNLLILIKPTIIRTAEEMRDITDRKKSETENANKPPEQAGEEFPAKGFNILKD